MRTANQRRLEELRDRLHARVMLLREQERNQGVMRAETARAAAERQALRMQMRRAASAHGTRVWPHCSVV